FLPVGERGFDARVGNDLERLGRDPFAAHRETDLVRAWRNLRTSRAGGPENHSGEARRIRVAHVPQERVDASLVRGALRGWRSTASATAFGRAGCRRGRGVSLAGVA